MKYRNMKVYNKRLLHLPDNLTLTLTASCCILFFRYRTGLNSKMLVRFDMGSLCLNTGLNHLEVKACLILFNYFL